MEPRPWLLFSVYIKVDTTQTFFWFFVVSSFILQMQNQSIHTSFFILLPFPNLARSATDGILKGIALERCPRLLRLRLSRRPQRLADFQQHRVRTVHLDDQ